MTHILSTLRLPHLTIGARIFLGFGVVIAVLAAQAVVGNLGFDRVVTHFKRYGETNQEVRDILAIERNVLDLQRGVMAFTYSGYAGVAQRVKELQGVLGRQIDTVRAAINNPRQRDVLLRMEGHFHLYADNFDIAIEERTKRDQLAFDGMMRLGDEIISLLEGIHLDVQGREDTQGIKMVGSAQEMHLLTQRDALLFLVKPKSTLVRDTKGRLAQFSGLLERLIEHLAPGRSREQAMRIRALTGRYEESFFGMVQATRAYMHLVYVVMGGEAAEISWLARELRTLSLGEQEQVQFNLSTAVDNTRTITGQVAILATLLGLVLAWGIGRNIAAPVQAMTRALTSLARGRMDTEIPGKGRKDEIGAMAMAADIFKEKAHELENASRYKSEFLANMSHELRTPLNSLLILSKILSDNQQGNLTRDQVESATVIHESGSDLLRLINDILDLSKAESGRMDLYVEEKGFLEMGHAIERLFRPLADKKGLKFAITIEDDLPDILATDWGKVEQVMRNFLSNAFKFTAEGRVAVRVGRPLGRRIFMNPHLSKVGCLALSVSDTGIGIPEDKREQIFEAFRQADGSTSRQYGGTGLGLTISRKFADLLGGEIQVESQEGQGAEFTLYLPLELPPAVEKGAGALSPGSKALGGTEHCDFKALSSTVLLVDDDRRNLFALRRVLEGRVGTLLTAGNGQEAMALLNDHPDVDLVLMDIMMPVMDGYAAMRAIRAQPRFSRLPLLALTAKVMPGDREKCLEAGASDYLAKPVDGNALLMALEDWLGEEGGAHAPQAGGNQERDILPKMRTLADHGQVEMGDPRPDLGDASITVLLVGDDIRNTFSLSQALQGKVARVRLARNGIKALEELEREKGVAIVLMDATMPDMDGLEAIREIRRRPHLRHLPVIALTAQNTPEERDRCLAAGANDFVSKPVDRNALLMKMRLCLQSLDEGSLSVNTEAV